MMRKYFVTALLVFTCSLPYSSHLIGGFITHEKNDGLTYKFTLHYLLTSPFGAKPYLILNDSDTVKISKSSERQLEENAYYFKYTGNYTFAAPGEYTVSYSDGRSSSINLSSTGNDNFHIYHRFVIDPFFQNQASPQIHFLPSFKAGYGSSLFSNFEFEDSDGDILRYNLTEPMSGSRSSIISYKFPQDREFYSDPESAKPIFKIDKLNGSLFWNEIGDIRLFDVLTYYNVAFEVKEYSKSDPDIELSRTLVDINFEIGPYETFDLVSRYNYCYDDLEPVELTLTTEEQYFFSRKTLSSLISVNDIPSAKFMDSHINPGEHNYSLLYNVEENNIHFPFQIKRNDTTYILNGYFNISENNCEDLVDEILSVNKELDDVVIYPNPAKNVIYLDFNETKPSFFRFTLINISGQLILDKSAQAVNNQIILSDNIENGLYFVKLFDNNGNEKAVKKLFTKR